MWDTPETSLDLCSDIPLSNTTSILICLYSILLISFTCFAPCSVLFQQAQEVIERRLSILDTEDWGSGLLCAGVWPDGFPSALLSTEDSCFSSVLRDGQVLSFCLNTLSMQGKR